MNPIIHAKKEHKLLLLVSQIIAQDVTNVNIYGPTVVDVKLSNDGSHLNIYMSFASHENKSLDAINHAKGFIRSQIARYWDKRKVPELHFMLDPVGPRAEKIDQILKKIKEEEK
ncbi:30S ribosome-binding factor RbfA [Mycoplasma iguanae]|uniref:Ribosome-binding factor A n=1 Tax=Mycoplasma iguanae TaxID=292461 RepID=A0ABY5R9G5_9MOLU|nr:30S ribosome-binding factor RbfA [Mycoplasma iguanae]UVD81812.1 30S ribosome-binding factor RbfA [Mycoplasma iguanae]